MSNMIKYRVHEVAKDFDRSSKQISEILGEFGMAPKNNQKVLEERELDIIFAALTQRNQVEDLGAAVAATRRRRQHPRWKRSRLRRPQLPHPRHLPLR